MNDNAILYQSLSIAVIIHLALALIFSHTTIWENIANLAEKDKDKPIVVDVVDLPEKPSAKTNIPKDASKGVKKPSLPAAAPPKPDEKPVQVAKAAPQRPMPRPLPVPVPRTAPAPSPAPMPQRALPDVPDIPSVEAGPAEKVDTPRARSTAGPNPDGTYSDGPDVSDLPTLPKRIVQPTVDDLMRYAKVDKEPAQKSPENTITMDTTDLKYTSYMLGLKRRIETIWQYPETSRRAGEQGELVIRFVIAKSGKLEEAEVVKSSGYPMLDKAATKALRDASPFNPLPESWGQDTFQVTGNFIYHLYDFYVR